ncbi:DUF4160 domain-containing protein [Parasphingorhabdus sp.]|uniref:DUF4160 domain-containing protein n=1 Tax=Parasphingorhabdus sp. TaxID=2709688 RepID=UPI003D2746A1
MPVVFRENGYRFYFYSNEGDPREPIHIHITKGGSDAKFWLYPETALAYNFGFNASALNLLEKIVSERRTDIEEFWHDYFSQS